MSGRAETTLTQAIFSRIHARYPSAINWIATAIGVVFVFGVISAAVSDFNAHGGGQSIDTSEIGFSYNVDEQNSQVHWNVNNTTGQVLGSIEVSCTANDSEVSFLVGDYVAVGQAISGAKYESIFGHDTVCKLTSAMVYRK